MNETLELPDWDDVEWETIMKKAISSSDTEQKSEPVSIGPTSIENDRAWLRMKTRDFTSYERKRIKNNEEENYLTDPELKPPLSRVAETRRTAPLTKPPHYRDSEVPARNQTTAEFIVDPYSVPSTPQVKENYPQENGFPQENLLKSVILEVRSLFLSSSEQLKLIQKLFTHLNNHISNESDFDSKTINNLVSSSFHTDQPKFQIVFRKLYQRYPQLLPMEEILLFDESYQQLTKAMVQSIEQIGKCFELKKFHYLQQLKNLKEVSNNAIRKSIQTERANTIQAFNQLKANYEQQLQNEKNKIEEDRKHLLQEKRVIEEEYLRTKMHLEEMIEKDKISAQRQQDAIKQALKEQKHDHQQELKQLKENMIHECNRLKEECNHQINRVQQTNEASFVELKNSEREKREMIEQAKENVEQECNLLRKENAQYAAQLNVLREQFSHQMQEMRERHTRDIQERTANDIQSQAMIKNELALTMQRIQKEEHRRKEELEEQYNKMRQSMLTSHALEIEKLQDRHRSEIKRLQAELEAQNQEGVYKLKHLHEQELNRQIRENDRLQRLLARKGVATSIIAESGNFNIRPSSKSAFGADAPSSPVSARPVYHTLTPKGKSKQFTADRITADSNLKDAETSEFRTNSDLGLEKRKEGVQSRLQLDLPSKQQKEIQSTKLNWGFLENSLKTQDEGSAPKFSSENLPPDPFPLNEAMESTKSKNDGIGISTNATLVTSYLRQLEDYLQGKEVRIEDEVKQITDPLERKNYILSSIHDSEEDENESDSLGDGGMNLSQLAQLPLEISNHSRSLFPMNSSSATSSEPMFEHLQSRDTTFDSDFRFSSFIPHK